jgi:L-fuconolactonase
MAHPAIPSLIDTHLHVWQRGRFNYHWIQPDSPLDCDFDLADMLMAMATLPVMGGILVEAANTSAEIEWLLAVAASDSKRWGVVGWIDLEQATAPQLIAHFAQQSSFKGVRLNWVVPHPNPGLLTPAMETLAAHRLVVDVLTLPAHWDSLIEFMETYQATTFVVEHLGGITITNRELSSWHAGMARLAHLPNVVLKVSAFTTPTLPEATTFGDYLKVVLSLFGPERLLFGSNWPICLATLTYTDTVLWLHHILIAQNFADLDALFWGNAARIYSFYF